jgi:hypothetical protein
VGVRTEWNGQWRWKEGDFHFEEDVDKLKAKLLREFKQRFKVELGGNTTLTWPLADATDPWKGLMTKEMRQTPVQNLFRVLKAASNGQGDNTAPDFEKGTT